MNLVILQKVHFHLTGFFRKLVSAPDYYVRCEQKSMKRLYLDDVRTPLDDSWHVVRSYREFCLWILENGIPDEISFDHDLGYHIPEFASKEEEIEALKQPMVKTDQGWFKPCVLLEKSGYDCAKWLVENDLVPNRFYVHSANPVGADNILSLPNNWQRFNGVKPNGYKTFWECKVHEDEIY